MSNLPHIVAVTVTYARPRELESAIACFLAQKYDGPKSMVILNTFPRQTLKCNDHPEILIQNYPKRPNSLGEARNDAVMWAGLLAGPDALAVTWDDDDGATSWHLANYGNNCDPDCDWVWLNQEYFLDGFKIKSVAQGTPNTLAFRIRAFKEIAGYPKLTVGEDGAMISKLTAKFKGKRVNLQPYEISFCRNWGTGIYHTSGEGDDKPNRQTAHARVAEWADSQINMGKMPTGEIALIPKLQADYDALAQEFSGAINRMNEQKIGKVGLVYLGRYGDILNCLPIAKHIADRYAKPLFFVSKQYSHVLEGVSYVEPVILEMPYDNIKAALQFAAHKVELLINCQVWGVGFQVEKQNTYNRDSWFYAGMKNAFSDTENFPLVIDRRDPAREQALRDKLPMAGKPTILVNVKGDAHCSSPYPQAEQFLATIRAHWASRYNVIDLSGVRAERIYDLLGVFDRTACLITSDTATLHLAAASTIPVISLVNDIDWLGSAPRCNCLFRVKYGQAMDSMGIIDALITELYARPRNREPLKLPPAYVKPARKLIHAVERHSETRPDVLKRKQKAWDSWNRLYEIGVIPAHYSEYKRDSRDIGDNRALPYLKDVLEYGMSKATSPFDIIFWSNDDNILHPDLASALAMFCSIYDCCSSQRREFKTPYPEQPMSPESIVCISGHHMGRDMVAGTRDWWLKNWDEIPDFLLGAPVFDLCLASMIRLKKGFHTDRQNIETNIPSCELPLGYISHTFHEATWSVLPAHNPANAYNARLFAEWAAKYAPKMRVPL